jgi:hypothetical protein
LSGEFVNWDDPAIHTNTVEVYDLGGCRDLPSVISSYGCGGIFISC